MCTVVQQFIPRNKKKKSGVGYYPGQHDDRFQICFVVLSVWLSSIMLLTPRWDTWHGIHGNGHGFCRNSRPIGKIGRTKMETMVETRLRQNFGITSLLSFTLGQLIEHDAFCVALPNSYFLFFPDTFSIQFFISSGMTHAILQEKSGTLQVPKFGTNIKIRPT